MILLAQWYQTCRLHSACLSAFWICNNFFSYGRLTSNYESAMLRRYSGCCADMNGSFLMEGRELKPLRSSKWVQGSPTSNMSDIITMKSGLGIPIGFVTIKYLKRQIYFINGLLQQVPGESVLGGSPSRGLYHHFWGFRSLLRLYVFFSQWFERQWSKCDLNLCTLILIIHGKSFSWCSIYISLVKYSTPAKTIVFMAIPYIPSLFM